MNGLETSDEGGPSSCKRQPKKKECKPPPRKCDPCLPKPSVKERKMDEIFANNIMLLNGLLPFIPVLEREKVQKWMKKLYALNTCLSDRITRDDYLWFLLVQLSNGTVTVPFVYDPPEGKLRPVPSSVPDKKIYEEILQAANNQSEFNDLYAPITNNVPNETSRVDFCTSKEEKKCKKCKPAEFLQKQPYPGFGFLAYGSCFSNQD